MLLKQGVYQSLNYFTIELTFVLMTKVLAKSLDIDDMEKKTLNGNLNSKR